MGSTPAGGNFTQNGFQLCKEFPGTVSSGDVIAINCTSVIVGRFVVIQMKGANKVLTLCEVEIFPSKTGILLILFWRDWVLKAQYPLT